MNPTLMGVIGIAIMVALFFSRMPVAYVMAMMGALGFSVIISVQGGLNLLSRDMYSIFSSYGLTTIPLFVLMGQFAFNAGISRRLYNTAYKFLGSTRGGLAMATVAACTAFGAVCGSSPATAATMATVGLPEMKRYGYADELATGAVASGGSLGMLMPPSVVLIVYGILTEQSIGKLFVAGIIPAILITILFLGAIAIRCAITPEQGPRGEKFTLQQKIRALVDMSETLLIFLMVIGGLFFGFFTPTEAGAVGAFLVLLLAVIRRQITWKGFVESLFETLKISCMIMLLVASAAIFSHFLAVTRIPFNVAGWVGKLQFSSTIIMGMIVLVYLVGGCFMDSLAFIMLTIPIFFPIVTALGYDPIWFGIIIVLVHRDGCYHPTSRH